PGWEAHADEQLAHDLWRGVHELDSAPHRFGETLGHLCVGECLWAGEIVGASLVARLCQCRRSDSCDVADVYDADLRVAGGGEELPLRDNRLAKNQQTLHEQGWTPKRVGHS